jgi:hypothetical protein
MVILYQQEMDLVLQMEFPIIYVKMRIKDIIILIIIYWQNILTQIMSLLQ